MQNYRRAAGFSGMMGQVSNKQSSETPADAVADPTSTTSKPASQSASKLPASDLSASEADYLQHLQLEASRTFEELEGEDRIDRSEVIADGVKEFAWWCLRLLVIAVTAYAAWFLLSKFSRGILPLALAILICSVLWPITRTLRNIGVPAGLASFATILAAFGFFGGLIALIAPSIGQQSQTLYYQAFEGVQKVQLWLQGPPLNVRDDDINKWFTDATIWLQRQSGTIAGELFAGIGVASTVMVTLGIVIVLTFFFLKDGDRFLPWLRSITGRRAGWHLTELLTRSWNTLAGFIRAQAIVSLVDAVFIGMGLVFLGVPMALALATLTFIAGFIPIVGAFVAGALAVLIAFVSLGFTKALIVLALVVAVQQLEGNILSPMLQSRAMNLHPVIVLLSVTIGSSLFGIVGAFLAVPVTALVAVLFRYLSDMVALRSGEKTADQIEFATAAGSLTGMHGEVLGRKLRAARRDRHASASSANSEEGTTHSDASEEDPETLLARLSDASAKIVQLFHKNNKAQSSSSENPTQPR